MYCDNTVIPFKYPSVSFSYVCNITGNSIDWLHTCNSIFVCQFKIHYLPNMQTRKTPRTIENLTHSSRIMIESEIIIKIPTLEALSNSTR